MEINPFNITKATDLTDQEINSYWVDLPEGKGFVDLMKPNSAMSQLILGGKGSGKTHLMRYFSFPLQKIRHKDRLINKIKDEGYIGIYFQCSGLNSSRFSGKDQTEEFWREPFSYYMELWLAQITLGILSELKDETNFNNESEIVKGILDLFDTKLDLMNYNLECLISTLKNLQKKVDISVNNYSLHRSFKDFKIIISPGSLIFGIPRIISKYLSDLSDVQFLYLLDEFENLTLEQQKYINTLIRDKKHPCSFRIGSRLYGIRTYSTFSALEENKEGSEFERFDIDAHFRSEKQQNRYDIFIRELIVKRLSLYGKLPIKKIESLRENLDELFENYDADNYIERLSAKYEFTTPPYLLKLKKRLEETNRINIENIINNLRYPKNILYEKTNVFLFYRKWNNQSQFDAFQSAKEIKQSLENFLNGINNNDHDSVLDKFKNDLVDQLLQECGEKIVYANLHTFIKMSAGIPRILLMILKHIYKWSYFAGESPFDSGKISIESQQKGIKDAANWFFEDASRNKYVVDSIQKIGQFLREIRFSDTPPECSICAFSVNLTEISHEANEIINLATQYSYIIKASLRKEKNSKRKDQIFQLNGILSPIWDLPIYKRGEINLNEEEANSIFNLKQSIVFNQILRKRLDKYNYPFSFIDPDQINLF